MNDTEVPIAPGMKYTHYSPKQPVYIVNGGEKVWMECMDKLRNTRKTFGILASDETIRSLEKSHQEVEVLTFSLGKKTIPQEASQRLYSGLRYFDDQEVEYILAEAYPKRGIGEAFMNRLEKASSGSYPS